MPRKKKDSGITPTPPQVTLIEDPFGIRTAEVAEAQNDPEELPLEEDFRDEDLELDAPDIEEQLKRLASAISEETEKFEEVVQTFLEDDPTARLAAEIAEDQALQQAIQQEQGEIQELKQELEQEQVLEQAPNQEQAQLSASEGVIETGEGPHLDLAELQSCIEAILFISDKPLSLQRLQALLGPLAELDLFSEALANLTSRYQASHHGIELVEVAGGYQFRTKPSRADLAKKLVKTQVQRLSSGSMETLAIVAYKQPVMKEEIDKIRGVDSSYFIRQLIDRKLIEISGRSELPGRPLLYATTEEFLEVFGLKDLSSMPSLRELEQMIPASQSNNPEDEDPKVREMRRLVGEMKSDRTSALYYNPKEDDTLLKEIREKVNSIPTSTPYLDEMKAAEERARLEAEALAKMAEAGEGAGGTQGETPPPTEGS